MNAFDLLRMPLVGRFLRWRRARTCAQLLLLAVSAVVIWHGLFGPQLAPANLATVLTWVHYRGLLIVALLAAGNFFCFGCPFVLARDAGRRLHAPHLRWPRRFRTKWIGVVLFVAVLFSYELFDLWSLPRATAWLVIGYFGAALVIDLTFSGASFCKYLCPIGQFNFTASTLSPLELRTLDTATCRTCRTADCIKGRHGPEGVVQRGCELGLFLPMKVGNMDCTFCLDCVQACPHDNVGLLVRPPGEELSDSRRRSGVGRLSRRRDIAALGVLFTFGALLNAFGMVAPAYRVEQWLSQVLGDGSPWPTGSEWPVLAIIFVFALGVAPLALLSGASGLARWLGRADTGSAPRTAVTYAYALVPLGCGMWLAHYGFHLLTGVLTVVPVLQSAVIDLFGRAALGGPYWRWAGIRPGAVWPIQLGCVMMGALGSMAVAYRISEQEFPGRPGRAAAPFAAISLVLAAVAVWILSQPMEMRGTGFLG